MSQPNLSRLEKQLAFILEIDRLKSVLRRTYLLNENRRENSAEHSWHLAVMAMVLAEHANEPVDVCQVMRMVVVHDIVEVDAGDTFVYDAAGNLEKAAREQKAAVRIFGLLPDDQRAEVRALWDEFEARTTAESRFANAIDRVMPVLHNYHGGGGAWREHGISGDRIMARNQTIAEGSTALWDHIRGLIEHAVSSGMIQAK